MLFLGLFFTDISANHDCNPDRNCNRVKINCNHMLDNINSLKIYLKWTIYKLQKIKGDSFFFRLVEVLFINKCSAELLFGWTIVHEKKLSWTCSSNFKLNFFFRSWLKKVHELVYQSNSSWTKFFSCIF